MSTARAASAIKTVSPEAQFAWVALVVITFVIGEVSGAWFWASLAQVFLGGMAGTDCEPGLGCGFQGLFGLSCFILQPAALVALYQSTREAVRRAGDRSTRMFCLAMVLLCSSAGRMAWDSWQAAIS